MHAADLLIARTPLSAATLYYGYRGHAPAGPL